MKYNNNAIRRFRIQIATRLSGFKQSDLTYIIIGTTPPIEDILF